MLKMTNDLIDYSKMYMSSISRYLIFHVTSKCNATCEHCFYYQEIENYDAEKELKTHEIDKIASNFEKLEIVNLSGAEAFLRKDLVEIVDIFHKRNDVRIIAIPTNGSMTKRITKTTERLLKTYPGITFRISISIDFIGEKHDRFRGIPGNFESASKTFAELGRLKNEYSNLVLLSNTTFCRDNQHDILDILKYIRNNFPVNTLSLTLIRGEPRDSSQLKDLDLNKYKRAVDYVNNYGRLEFSNHPMSKLIWNATAFARNRVAEIAEDKNFVEGNRRFKCYPVNRFLVIESDGDIKLCEILPESLGNLRDYNYDIKEIMKLDNTKKWIKKVHDGFCNCTWECAVRTGILYNPIEYPKMAAYALRASINSKRHDSANV